MLVNCLVILALGLAGPQAAPPRAAPEAPHSLVIVTVDTLRREHLGCYGYPRPTSPRLDALAAEAVLFERAFAPMATTFPSHLSLLTGLYPHQHGHTSNRGAVRQPYAPAPGRLSVALPLTEAGYRSAAFTSSVVLHARTGVGAGFQTFDAPRITDGTRTARATVQGALDWLLGVPADQPIFLWVHLWDTHEPNTPEPAFAELLAPDGVLTQWVRARGLDLSALQARFADDGSVGERFFGLPPREVAPADRKQPPRFTRPQDAARARRAVRSATIDEPALLSLYARYDACVRQVDTEVGRLVDALRARGTWGNTAFVFTADHGQSLGEGLFFGHGVNTLVNTAVPLVVSFPESVAWPSGSWRGLRSRALVSLVDLLPTLLGRLRVPGLEAFRAQLVGADALAPDFARERVFTSEATEFHRGDLKPYACAVQTGRWKYVRAEGGPARLYDLEGAGEGVDVAAENATLVEELERLLAAELATSILGREEGEAASPESEELLRQLEDLGYAGDEDE